MWKVWILLVLIALATVAQGETGAKEAPARGMDLDEVYRRTLERSESLQITKEDWTLAEAAYWQAMSGVLPDLRVQGNLATARRESREKIEGAPFLGGQAQYKELTVSETEWETRPTVRWAVFRGFREWNRMAGAKAQKEVARWQWQRQAEILFLNVADVFYQVVRDGRDLDLLKEQLAALGEREESLKGRLELGRSTQSELLTAKSEVAKVEVTVEQVRGSRAAGMELLAFLTGVPSDKIEVRVTGTFPKAEEMGRYLEGAAARADVQASQEQVRAGEREMSARRGELLPSVEARTSYAWRDTSEPTRPDEEWAAGLAVDVPIWDGGLTQARIQEGRALLRQRELNLDRARRMADYEVRAGYVRFESLARQYIKLGEAEKIAGEAWDVLGKDYELGRANNLDVLVALVGWQERRRQKMSAELQARAALAALQVAAGRVPMPEKIVPPIKRKETRTGSAGAKKKEVKP